MDRAQDDNRGVWRRVTVVLCGGLLCCCSGSCSCNRPDRQPGHVRCFAIYDVFATDTWRQSHTVRAFWGTRPVELPVIFDLGNVSEDKAREWEFFDIVENEEEGWTLVVGGKKVRLECHPTDRMERDQLYWDSLEDKEYGRCAIAVMRGAPRLEFGWPARAYSQATLRRLIRGKNVIEVPIGR